MTPERLDEIRSQERADRELLSQAVQLRAENHKLRAALACCWCCCGREDEHRDDCENAKLLDGAPEGT